MSTKYVIKEETHSERQYATTAYGITVYEKESETTATTELNDITSDKVRLEKLVENCNKFELSSLHLKDVVEDFLADDDNKK